MEDNKIVEEVKLVSTDTEKVETESSGFSFDDVKDSINPILPKKPVNGKCVDVLLKSVPHIAYVDVQGKGSLPVVKCEFVDHEGATAVISLFLPTEEIDASEQEKKLNKLNLANIKHLVGGLCKDISGVSGKTYFEATENLLKKIDPKVVMNEKLQLNVKFVYNKKNGLTVSNYSFLSSVIRPLNFEWNPTYDFDTKVAPTAAAGGLGTGGINVNTALYGDI